MKTAVLDLKDYIGWLKTSRENFAKELPHVLTPDDIKAKSLEAIVSKPGHGVIALKEVLDSIKKESFIQGQLSVLDHMISVAEALIKKYEDANGSI